MATPARKRATTTQDDRKPRPKTYAAFICAQPYDIPAKEITKAARSSGYDVTSISAVEATRKSYPHLRFTSGDPPTPYVIEFLQSPVSRKAKNYTSANSSVEFERSSDDVKFMQNVLKGATVASVPEAKKRPFDALDIGSIVDSVLRKDEDQQQKYRQATKNDPIDHDAIWGRRADGTPRKKSGPKSKGSVSIRERMASAETQSVIDAVGVTVSETKPTPIEDPIAQFLEAVGETPELKSAEPELKTEIKLAPAPEAKQEDDKPAETELKPGVVKRVPSTEPAVKAAPTEDDVLLQKMRDSFEIGDCVQVSMNSRNGPFRLEGEIKDKKSKFAVVVLPNGTTDMFPYKRLSLAPRMAGNGVARNGNGRKKEDTADENGLSKGPLTAVPTAFSKLRAVAPLETAKRQRDDKPASEPAQAPVQSPAEAVAQARADAEAANLTLVLDPVVTDQPEPVVPEPEPVTQPESVVSAAPKLASMEDLIAYVEMGKPFYGQLPAYQATLRADAERETAEIDQLELQEIEIKKQRERKIVERDAKLKRASDIDAILTLMKALGGAE